MTTPPPPPPPPNRAPSAPKQPPVQQELAPAAAEVPLKAMPMPMGLPVHSAPSGDLDFQTPSVQFEPPRILFYSPAGWGKTSLGAYAYKPAIIMAPGETGYKTLLGNGRAPKIPAITVSDWTHYMAFLQAQAAKAELPYKTLVIDAMGGMERMCHQFVCEKEYGGDWGEKGFTAFKRGYDVALPVWTEQLQILDMIQAKGVCILYLGHSIVKPYKNPTGPDFDIYTPDIHPKTFGVTHRWANAVMFGNFIIAPQTDRRTSKAKAGTAEQGRVVYTGPCDAWEAKNQYGMPFSIQVETGPDQMFNTLINHMKGNTL